MILPPVPRVGVRLCVYVRGLKAVEANLAFGVQFLSEHQAQTF